MSEEKLAVLASGRGSNFKAILEHVDFNILQNVEVEVLISDNPNAKALEIAENFGIENEVMVPDDKTREEHDKEILEILREKNITTVALAGYMKIITPILVKNFKNNMLNIHPSLLPSFPGLNSQEKALEYGVKVSGCTIHYVTEEIDSGPIILQHPVPVMEEDEFEDLSKRTLIFEHRLFSKALQLHVDNRLTVNEGKVSIDYSKNWEEGWNERQEKFIRYQKKEWDNKYFEKVWT